MSTTTTELPGLLRGCVKWRDGRAWVDNDALLVVADWCDDNGRPEEAEAIRVAMAWEGEESFFLPESPERLYHDSRADGQFGPARTFRLYTDRRVDLRTGTLVWGDVKIQRHVSGTATSYAAGVPDHVQHVTRRDECARGEGGGPPLAPGDNERYPAGALERIRDLARWDLICHMLGYPPMRLLGEE